jgi:hypothetical protein
MGQGCHYYMPNFPKGYSLIYLRCEIINSKWLSLSGFGFSISSPSASGEGCSLASGGAALQILLGKDYTP